MTTDNTRLQIQLTQLERLLQETTSTLEAIVEYCGRTRRLGYSSSLINGIDPNKKYFLLQTTMGENIFEGRSVPSNVKVVSLSEIKHKLRGVEDRILIMDAHFIVELNCRCVYIANQIINTKIHLTKK